MLAILLVLATVQPGFLNQAHAEVVVAAASSIRNPLDALVDRYQDQFGVTLKIVYGASGSLAHQILRGAPFDLFLSADEAFPARIWKTGLTVSKPVTYAKGSLGVYANHNSHCQPKQSLADLMVGQSAGKIDYIAIANPTLAPYGKAAQQALEQAGVWAAVQQKLVYGNSVAQTAQFGLTGAADCSIIPRSLSLTHSLKRSGSFHPISPHLYTPLRHNMVLLDTGNTRAEEFQTFLLSSDATASFVASGFSSPHE